MNILFFLTPKSEVAHIYEDDTVRQALDKMEGFRYSTIPLLSKDGTPRRNHYGRRPALGNPERIPDELQRSRKRAHRIHSAACGLQTGHSRI